MTTETMHGRARDAISTHALLVCTRDWSAWTYGTMTDDDFLDASDDPEIVQELVDDILTLDAEAWVRMQAKVALAIAAAEEDVDVSRLQTTARDMATAEKVMVAQGFKRAEQ